MASRRVSVRSRSVVAFLALALAASLLTVPLGRASAEVPGAARVPAAAPVGAAPINPKTPKAVFFAADGLRQDLIPKYAGFFSTMNLMLRLGTSASDNGLLTQAPPNTGAGWYSLATGAWPGVHGSTNNTFHTNGQAFGTASTSAFAPNILQAESIAQAAERGGLKVAQVEWAGGRNASIAGPTIDFRSFLSGRGVTTNFIGKPGEPLFDDDPFIRAFGLQFDHPAGHAGQPAFPAAQPAAATGWTGALPQSFSPPMEMRMRVLDFGVDKYGLNAYIYDSTNNRRTDYNRVLFSRSKNAADMVADLRQGETADVKVTIDIDGSALDGKTAGFLVKVEQLSPDLSRVRLFHTSVSRAIATWPSWPKEPGFTDFDEFLAQRFPTSTAADFAVLEAGVVSEETYVEQGLYWSKAHVPMLEYIANTYQPDFLMVGMPTTDEFQHQFLGLITPTLPGGAPNPAYDDVDLNGVPDGRVRQREGFIRDAYREADAVLSKARRLIGFNPTTFVSSDHGFAPQFLAVDASEPLKKLGLLSANQTGNCRTAPAEAIGSAKACWAGGALQIYLNVAGRDPAPGVSSTIKQIPANMVGAKVDEIKAAYLGLEETNDWNGDGSPEGWQIIDRVFSKAEARYIPNGPGTTADMAHPTRTGDVVVFALPPYQFDAATPGELVAPSHFFGQHGYVPDLQDLSANVNMRATFIAGGEGIRLFNKVEARSIDLAPTLAYLLGIPEPQHSQGRVLTDVFWLGGFTRPVNIIGLNDFHGQLSPTTSLFDNINNSVGGIAFLKTMFDEEFSSLVSDGLILSAGDNVGASPPNSLLLDDIPTIEALNQVGLDATAFGNHEFDYGVTRIITQQAVANFPWLAANIVETATGLAPPWVDPTQVFTVNGIRVGVIGAELQNTPELVSAGNTAGLTFLPEAERIKAESERLQRQGVLVQVVVIHQGTNVGRNPTGNTSGQAWEGPILPIADELQDTTIDAMIVGHTHRVSNLMRGDILIVEGINAGVSYSVLQLMVRGNDVEWAGGATRVAKNLGVAPDPAVQAIVQAADDTTAPQRNRVIGTQVDDIRRDPTRLHESEMGNMVADAMRAAYPEVEAALVNSGGLRADLVFSPPSGAEAPGQITWGEMFAVLPFGNRTALMTVTGAQLRAAFVNGFLPACDSGFAGGTGRFPQVSGLRVQFHCAGTTPVIDVLSRAPDGPLGTLTPILDTDSLRIVALDFLFTGGDGYTSLTGATNVTAPDTLLDVVIAYVTAKSPVNPLVEGRITST